MSDRLTPTNVAKRLDVSTSTVRRITGEYADWLSPTATPRPGGTRIYTEQDVEILAIIVAMRQDGAPEDEIIRAIESGIIPANVATLPPQPPQQPTMLSIDTSALQDAISRQAAVQQVSIDVMRESNASMDKHSAALERLANSLVIFGALILIAVLLTIAVAVGWI